MDSVPRLLVRLLGHIQLAQGQQVIARFGTRKAGALLAYLAFYRDTAHAREILAEILWPGSNPRSARANLRVVLNELRHHLEPSGTVPPGTVLRTDNSSIELCSDFLDTDVSQFTAALSAADALALAPAGAEERILALTRAVELYSGDLLPGYYEDWVAEPRETLKNQCRDALSALAVLLTERKEIDRALRYATAAVSMDAFREESHVELIRLYVAAGDHCSAQRQYRKMERMLYREAGRGPSAATRALLSRSFHFVSGASGATTGGEHSQQRSGAVADPHWLGGNG